VNAGTVEFLVDPDGDRFYFLEVNARLQVEHTITEAVLGVDLVAAQLRIAAGDPVGFGPEDLAEGGRLAPRGHAIECRINAEDPARGFLPGPGRLSRYREPGGPGVRVDGGFAEGLEVPGAYDSLIAKVIAWGGDREEARRRMIRALEEFEIEGVPSTIPAHVRLLSDPAFVDGTYTTRTVEGGALEGLVGPAMNGASTVGVLMVAGTPVHLWHPAMATSVGASADGGAGWGAGAAVAPMHGTILSVTVAEGDRVEAGDPVAVLEAMKMETVVAAPVGGTVGRVEVRPGAVVEAGAVIATID
jgi:acetyl-CoA/propionyl-CoA carboxylase biotin carboxyl carrier protein